MFIAGFGVSVSAAAMSVSCLVCFNSMLVFSPGRKYKGCYRGPPHGLMAHWDIVLSVL